MTNYKLNSIFCSKLLSEMIRATKNMYDQTQELLDKFSRIEDGNINESIEFIDNIIDFYKEKSNKILQSYLDKCKVWKDEVITAKQLEKVLMVEEALNQSLVDNNEILKLAYQYKAKFNNKDSVYPLH